MEKSTYKYFAQDCLNIFFLDFTSLKKLGNSKNGEFFVENIKPPHKYCSPAIGTGFSAKFILDVEMQNRPF